MNINIGERDIISNETITMQPNLKEKAEVKHIIYTLVKRLIDIIGS